MGGDDEADRLVTIDELQSVDVDATIGEFALEGYHRISSTYERAAKAAEENGNMVATKAYRILAAISSIHFKPEDDAEPYGPMFVMDGQRSLIPDDLRGDQSAVLAQIASGIANPLMRARMADIVWINDRRRADMATLAIDAGCQAAAAMIASTGADDGEENTGGMLPLDATHLLRRGCQIARATGWKPDDVSTLTEKTTSAFALTVQDPKRGFLRVAKLALDYSLCEASEVASNAEAAAGSADDPHFAQALWELAARAHTRCKAKPDADRCLTEAAECDVRMAKAANFTGMTAASFLSSAIGRLRKIGGTGERRKELEDLLRSAQSSMHDEMVEFAYEIDLTEPANQARAHVTGLSLPEALKRFALLEASPSRAELEERVNQLAKDAPLTSIIASTIHDEEGKMVAKSPGIWGSDDPNEAGMRQAISQQESTRRQVVTGGLIEPARLRITAEHSLTDRSFGPIVQFSPFVPPGYEMLFARGFSRFFGGDRISSLYILAPQLENSLRHLLKLNDIDPSFITNDGTQENLTLGVMLSRNKNAMTRILGEEILFEIDNLFDLRGGPSLRHQTAHGLVNSGQCFGTDTIYACWLLYKMTVLPILRNWEHVEQAYQSV